MSRAAEGCLGILVVARNEERSLGPCLGAWRRAQECAQRHWGSRAAERGQGRNHDADAGAAADDALLPPLLVVLDACSDRSADVAVAHGAILVHASGGKVAAQQAGLAALLRRASADPSAAVTATAAASSVDGGRSAVGHSAGEQAFVVCSDADILVEPSLLATLCDAMSDPRVRVAFPAKRPLPPRRRSLLARSIHTYNRWGGFASRRTWFSGQAFAIRARDLVFPSPLEIAARAARLPFDRFLRLDQPLRADDIYLSQAVVAAHGLGALCAVEDSFWFRAPETLAGMYHKYRRMRAELERIERLFPELEEARRACGRRTHDRLAQASPVERAQFLFFQAAVTACAVGYRIERAYHRFRADRAPDLWPPLEDTKLHADDATGSFTSSSGMPSWRGAPSSTGATTAPSRGGSPAR